MNIKNDNYIQILGWMINELNLKGNELLVYALIHGFCQDGKSVFKGSLNYIMSWLNISKPTCIATIQSLIDKGLIVKTVIYNKNSVAGCEYYTTKSRNVETNQKNNSKNDEKGGKEILPPQNEKVTEGGKETLPGWSENFTSGGKETLPNNTNDNTKNNATAANKTYFEALSEKYFGKNAFDFSFADKAAAFFKNQNLKPESVEPYFDFIKNKVCKKQAENPRGLAYRLFFQNDIMQEFLTKQHKLILEQKEKQEKEAALERKKIFCPCCNTRFVRTAYIQNCPECDFPIDHFENKKEVEKHKKYMLLPEEKRRQYDREICGFKIELPFVERIKYIGTSEGKKKAELYEHSVNRKYGIEA